MPENSYPKVSFRISQEELSDIDKAVKHGHYKSRSGFIKEACRAYVKVELLRFQ